MIFRLRTKCNNVNLEVEVQGSQVQAKEFESCMVGKNSKKVIRGSRQS